MDKELRDQFDAINARLDNLTQNSSQKGKNSTSMWKRISITIPVVVALIGLLGTGYELGLRFLDNQSNRQTIQFYTTLARALVENGHYNQAKVYLTDAEDIDENNADVVSTKAFIDMMELVRATVKTNPDALRDAAYNLSRLNLQDEEMFYHIGIVAKQEGQMHISEEHFRRIVPTTNRFSLRARARLIDVYVRTMQGRAEMDWEYDELVDFTMEILPQFIDDVLHYIEDYELRKNLIDEIDAQVFALTFLLPLDDLLTMNEVFAQIDPPNEEIIAILAEEIKSIQGEESEDPESRLNSLYAVKQKSNKSSPLADQIDAEINRYSALIESEKSAGVVTRGDSEQKRQEGVRLSRAGEHKEAERIFMEILEEYESNNFATDETLYKTYFNLGLHYEYKLRNPEAAIQYYADAENLATQLDLKDASIYNTFGYLFYKLGKDATDTEKKLEYLEQAEAKLQTALAINPGYDKSKRTLEAVRTEFDSIEQMAYYQQQIQQMPQKKMSSLKR